MQPDTIDRIDSDLVEEVQLSKGYALMVERYDSILSDKYKDLRRERDPIAAAELRGWIQAIERVKEIPVELRREAP